MDFMTKSWLRLVQMKEKSLSAALEKSLSKLSRCSKALEELICNAGNAHSDTNAKQLITDFIKESAICCVSFHHFFDQMQMHTPLAPPTYEVHADQIREAVDAERRRLGISAQVDADRVLMLSTVHPISRYSRTASASPYDPEIRQALQLAHDEAYQAGLLKATALPSPCTVFFWHVYSRCNHQSCIRYPDNDNYLTKTIIDLICEVFGLQDIGTELALFHSTALDDELPQMTYVFVVPNDSDLAAFLSFPAVKARLLRV